ncbi:MAG: restriction endonuclease subunit S, partial [candidate division WOR-3 bacterium]|nr:restriction endonuclease subunit S [candidate division WOR-3 bacterium]
MGFALLNQRVGGFKVINENIIIPRFFYYLAQSDDFKSTILKMIRKSAQGNLSPINIKKVEIAIPNNIDEQKKIAEVLSTVDEAIAKVDEKIKKIERLKKGLMQRLLTKGIGHKEFKYSKELNCQIPKEWEVVSLGDKKICEDMFYGVTAKTVNYTSGIRILRTTDIKNYTCEFEQLPFCEITEKKNNLAAFFLKKGDIIIARAGTVGVSVVVDRDYDNIVFGSYLIKVKLKSNVQKSFIHYFFQSYIYWKYWQRAQGSTLKNINLPLLKSL